MWAVKTNAGDARGIRQASSKETLTIATRFEQPHARIAESLSSPEITSLSRSPTQRSDRRQPKYRSDVVKLEVRIWHNWSDGLKYR